MPAHRHVFSDDYHLFWSTTGWSPEEKCLRGGNGPYEPQCCGADDGPLWVPSVFDSTEFNLYSVAKSSTPRQKSAALTVQLSHKANANVCA